MKNRVAVVGSVAVFALLAAGVAFVLLTKDDGLDGRGGRHLSHEELTRTATMADDTDQEAAIEALGGSLSRQMAVLPIVEVSLRDRPVTEMDLAGIGELPNLRDLDLSGTRMTDGSLHALKAYPNLVNLDLSRTGVTGARLSDLTALKELAELSLAHTRAADGACAALAELRGLTTLDLSGTAVTGVGLDRLKALPHLRSLNLADTAIADDAVAVLAEFNLEVLDVSRTRITSRSVPVFRRMKALAELSFAGTKVTPVEAEELKELFGADSLRSGVLDRSDESLGYARQTPLLGLAEWVEQRLHIFDEDRGDDADAGESLEGVIDLARSKVTDGGLKHLDGFHEYTVLLLGDSAVNGSGFTALAGHPKLRILTLENTPVTDAGLDHLGGLPSLYAIRLRNTAVTDAGLPALARVPKLSRLDLAGTRVTDAGLAALAGPGRLRTLFLSGTAVTDAGLKHLEGLKDLRYLNVAGTKVSEAGVKRLTAALPNCAIATTEEPFVLGLTRLPRPKGGPRLPIPSFGGSGPKKK